MCKVSIIMPVYNKEKYIENAIESILKQTFKEWELIIVDDGSTDSSYELCEQYQDERIKRIRSENGGVSRARNIGLSKASGEYVTFVDSDDYIAKDYLEKLYVPEYDMIIGGLMKVTRNKKLIAEVQPELDGLYAINVVAQRFYQEQIASGIYGFVAGKMIRRELIEKNGIQFDQNINLAEDYDFYLKVYDKISNIYFTQYAGYYYIQETENSAIVLDDNKIDFFTQIEIQKRTKDFLNKNKGFSREINKIYLERVTGYVYTILIMNKYLGYKKFCELMRKLKKIAPEVSKEMQGTIKLCALLYDKDMKLLIFILMKLKIVLGK